MYKSWDLCFCFPRDAWHALGDKSKVDAMVEYVSELSNVDQEWEDKVRLINVSYRMFSQKLMLHEI